MLIPEAVWLALFSALLGGGGVMGAMRAYSSYQAKKLAKTASTAADVRKEYNRHDEVLITYYQATIKDLQERVVKLEITEEGCQQRLKAAELEIQGLRVAVGRMEGGRLTGIITTDDLGNIIEWNNAATSLLQWSREEVLGKNLLTLMPPKLWAAHQLGFDRAVKTPDWTPPTAPLLTFALNRDGEEIPVSVLPSRIQRDGRTFFAAEVRRR